MRVVVGVSGGIAAYKSAELVRLLRAGGHEVRCCLTRAAVSFVTPLTLEILSGGPVHQEEYLSSGSAERAPGEELHIALAAWGDVLCVAPATAHLLARLALGLADDFLTTTALAFAGPVVVAPAMHPRMWNQAPITGHVAELERRGVVIVGPVHGPLASGETGIGRMAEPAAIAAAVIAAGGGGPLARRTVVVTAGPTREPIDPVRFLSNRSSGRMGFALAAAAAHRGARTILVAGPVALATPAGVERVDVTTAAEMEAALAQWAPGADLVVMAAAVADFRPREVAPGKLKKRDGIPRLDLVANPDLLAGLARQAPSAVRVGFAAESGEVEAEARRKLAAKEADFIVANDISRSDIGFETDANEVTVFRPDGEPVTFSRRSKDALAAALLELFAASLGDGEP